MSPSIYAIVSTTCAFVLATCCFSLTKSLNGRCVRQRTCVPARHLQARPVPSTRARALAAVDSDAVGAAIDGEGGSGTGECYPLQETISIVRMGHHDVV